MVQNWVKENQHFSNTYQWNWKFCSSLINGCLQFQDFSASSNIPPVQKPTRKSYKKIKITSKLTTLTNKSSFLKCSFLNVLQQTKFDTTDCTYSTMIWVHFSIFPDLHSLSMSTQCKTKSLNRDWLQSKVQPATFLSSVESTIHAPFHTVYPMW